MLKKVVVIVGIIFVLMVLIYGWDKTMSYVKGTQQVINAETDQRTPMKLESARITSLIQDENEKILRFEDRIADLETRRDATARTVNEANKKLAAEMELLKRIKALLDQKIDKYTIGKNTYTYAEVNADALERLEAVKRMQETVTFNENLLADLDTAIKQGGGSLAEGRKRLSELKSSMDRLETRNANSDIQLEVANLVNSIAGAPLSGDSELVKAVHNYDARIAAKERRAEARLAAGSGQFRIDYAASIITQDAASEIGTFIGDGSQGNVVAPAPQPQPPASEALEKGQ